MQLGFILGKEQWLTSSCTENAGETSETVHCFCGPDDGVRYGAKEDDVRCGGVVGIGGDDIV